MDAMDAMNMQIYDYLYESRVQSFSLVGWVV